MCEVPRNHLGGKHLGGKLDECVLKSKIGALPISSINVLASATVPRESVCICEKKISFKKIKLIYTFSIVLISIY
jgi:hypothetical protein